MPYISPLGPLPPYAAAAGRAKESVWCRVTARRWSLFLQVVLRRSNMDVATITHSWATQDSCISVVMCQRVTASPQRGRNLHDFTNTSTSRDNACCSSLIAHLMYPKRCACGISMPFAMHWRVGRYFVSAATENFPRSLPRSFSSSHLSSCIILKMEHKIKQRTSCLSPSLLLTRYILEEKSPFHMVRDDHRK